jgi:hypothetical protein
VAIAASAAWLAFSGGRGRGAQVDARLVRWLTIARQKRFQAFGTLNALYLASRPEAYTG